MHERHGAHTGGFQRRGASGCSLRHCDFSGAVGSSPRQLKGRLRAPETNLPSTADLHDTNVSIGYVHDRCPPMLAAAAGAVASVRLLSVLTLSSEAPGDAVARALAVYAAAKATPSVALASEHHEGWADLWKHGGVELTTNDMDLKQTTNATFYYLLMSTRDDWLHSTLVPSTIAASAPYPHGYFGTTFWCGLYQFKIHRCLLSVLSVVPSAPGPIGCTQKRLCLAVSACLSGTRTHSRRLRLWSYGRLLQRISFGIVYGSSQPTSATRRHLGCRVPSSRCACAGQAALP